MQGQLLAKDSQIGSLKGTIIQLEAQLVTARRGPQQGAHTARPHSLRLPSSLGTSRLPASVLAPSPAAPVTSSALAWPQPAGQVSSATAARADSSAPQHCAHDRPASGPVCRQAAPEAPDLSSGRAVLRAACAEAEPGAQPASSTKAGAVRPPPESGLPDVHASMHDSVDELHVQLEHGEDSPKVPSVSPQQDGQQLSLAPTDAEQRTLPSQLQPSSAAGAEGDEAVPETPPKSSQLAASPAEHQCLHDGMAPAPDHAGMSCSSGMDLQQEGHNAAAASSTAAPVSAARLSGHQDGSVSAQGPANKGEQQQQMGTCAAQQSDALQDLFFSFAEVAQGCSSGEDEGLHLELQPTSGMLSASI